MFRGIPYAQPPVGDLRFAAPVPALPWTGVREASRFGPPPPQSALAGPAPAASGAALGPDDWLTINVWSPWPRKTGVPVMVWIFGGAYMSGGATNPTYDGTRMAREGEVVLVTFNYRLGAEGFAQIAGAPANRGLLDQVAALRWVRDNIAAFGGDPEQVTIFGQSAGGGAVAAMMAMPEAAGLFRRAIVQSLPRPYLSPDLARSIAAELAASVSSEPARAALRNIPPPQLAAAGDALTRRLTQFAGRWGELADTPSPYAPVIDGIILPRDPWRALAAGSSRHVPLVIGHTRNEYRLFMALTGQLGTITKAQADQALRTFAPRGDAAAYRSAYPHAGHEELYELVNSDWLFRMPSVALAAAHAAAGGRTYLYELTHPVPAGHGQLGAPHGADVPLVFGNFTGGSARLTYGRKPPAATATLGAAMRSAWANFARTSDPGWAAFTSANLLTQIYDTPPTTAPYPEQRSRLLWQHQPTEPLDLPSGRVRAAGG